MAPPPRTWGGAEGAGELADDIGENRTQRTAGGPVMPKRDPPPYRMCEKDQSPDVMP